VSASTRRRHRGSIAPCAAQRGFTYMVVLVSVAVITITAGVAEHVSSRISRAEREAELLFRGMAYMRAIESFYKATGRYPRELRELVRDPSAAHRRHLRALYTDPMSKGEEPGWQLVEAPDGGISGVVSTSNDEPLKKANFPKALKTFTQAKSYKDWVFDYMPRARGTPLPTVTPPPPQSPPTPDPA
jgi:type II secretory pathway pseudopilin PulG